MNLRELVAGLDDPQRSWQVQMALIQWGEEAVEPLVEFLLPPPTLDPHPRCLAAEALGAIGGEKALEGLIKALTINDVAGRGPQIQLAEEAVRNCVAEQLGRAVPPPWRRQGPGRLWRSEGHPANDRRFGGSLHPRKGGRGFAQFRPPSRKQSAALSGTHCAGSNEHPTVGADGYLHRRLASPAPLGTWVPPPGKAVFPCRSLPGPW